MSSQWFEPLRLTVRLVGAFFPLREDRTTVCLTIGICEPFSYTCGFKDHRVVTQQCTWNRCSTHRVSQHVEETLKTPAPSFLPEGQLARKSTECPARFLKKLRTSRKGKRGEHFRRGDESTSPHPPHPSPRQVNTRHPRAAHLVPKLPHRSPKQREDKCPSRMNDRGQDRTPRRSLPRTPRTSPHINQEIKVTGTTPSGSVSGTLIPSKTAIRSDTSRRTHHSGMPRALVIASRSSEDASF